MKTKILNSLSLYATLLVIYRIYYTNSLFYSFMLWNLFLAFLPFLISEIIPLCSKKLLWFFFPLWLLFLPNAPYLLTDIFHLQKGELMPMWYDLLMLLTFSITGMFLYFLSLLKMYVLISKIHSVTTANIILYGSIFLSSFGIYLGRYLRWNSWEILQNPTVLFQDVFNRIIHPENHLRTWGITIGYSILFVILFWFVKNIKINFTFAENNTK